MRRLPNLATMLGAAALNNPFAAPGQPAKGVHTRAPAMVLNGQTPAERYHAQAAADKKRKQRMERNKKNLTNQGEE